MTGRGAGRWAWAMVLILATIPHPGTAQTVEKVFDPFDAGATTTIYPGETGLGATDLADLITWNVPGAYVERLPGGELRVTLRGAMGLANPSPNPLLIVDGYKVSPEDFSWRLLSLSPFRVERIIVLRDMASAAMFGGRAAGGVIMVYTRRR